MFFYRGQDLSLIHIFNSDEPSLRDDAKMVVLELGGLEDRPSLLVAVMFSLIIYIENRMYRLSLIHI